MEQNTQAAENFALVDEIRRGLSDAETALYEKFSARIYYLALKELRAPHDAEDARAETFLRVLQAIRGDRVHSPEALASFVLSTTRNVIREHVRQQRRSEQLDDEEMEKRADIFEPAHDDDSDVKNAIAKVVRRLKDREQAFLRMYFYEELPNDQIARALGIKEERLRLIKSRALKSFREHSESIRLNI